MAIKHWLSSSCVDPWARMPAHRSGASGCRGCCCVANKDCETMRVGQTAAAYVPSYSLLGAHQLCLPPAVSRSCSLLPPLASTGPIGPLGAALLGIGCPGLPLTLLLAPPLAQEKVWRDVREDEPSQRALWCLHHVAARKTHAALTRPPPRRVNGSAGSDEVSAYQTPLAFGEGL